MSAAEEARELLPATLRPISYDLRLEPHLDVPLRDLLGPENPDAPAGRVRSSSQKLFYDGLVEILIRVSAETSQVVLHGVDLEVSAARVDGPGGVKVGVVDHVMDKTAETLTVRLAGCIQPGEYTVSVVWTAELNNKMLGFYRSAYSHPEDSEGATRYMAVTQFEPTDARRAFPCFDEPAQKATFNVSLVVPKDRIGLSNMPIESTEQLESGKVLTKFQTTPVMSTYLLAFIVGELDYVEAYTQTGKTLVRIYTLPGSTHRGQFALEVATKTLDFFTNFFGCPYPLPKCDLIAVPDFAAGAMENWGCITFRETALLLDPQVSSASAKSRVAEVVAHELAHQWFGNLVTMEWWTHLWLNEGFATWAADLAVDTLFPTWQTWMQFVCNTFSRALSLDSLASSHPIEVEIQKSHQVNEIFDAISYCKGASAIRMLVEYLGLDTFQKGLKYYFTQHPYKNTSTEDLWSALQHVADPSIDVQTMMKKWTQQTGYPVLSVSESASTPGTFQVAQERFLSNGDPDKSGTTWMVPIGFLSSAQPETPRFFLLKDEVGSIPDTPSADCGWIKLNADQSGIYRVLYTADMYRQLRTPIQQATLSATDRLGILMDAVALARAGRLETTAALDVLSGFTNETEYTCLVDVVGSLGNISDIFGGKEDAEVEAAFNSFACCLLGPVGTEKLGWDAKTDEEHVVALSRTLVLTGLVEFGHKETIEEAKKRFSRFLLEPDSLPADLRLPVYYAVMKSGGRPEYEALIDLYDKASMDEEKIRLLRAMGKTTSVEILKDMLTFGLEKVKSQDLFYVVMAVGNNPLGRELAWEFVQQHWSKFVEKYGRGNFLLTRFIEIACRGFSSEDKAQEVEAFYANESKEGIERTLQQSLEAIRVRAAWRSRDLVAVKSWILTHKN